MRDRFWINAWLFFATVTVLLSLMMGGLFLLNNAAQDSDEASVEEKEAIHAVTYELWNEAKVLVPASFFILLISAWIYIKFASRGKDE